MKKSCNNDSNKSLCNTGNYFLSIGFFPYFVPTSYSLQKTFDEKKLISLCIRIHKRIKTILYARIMARILLCLGGADRILKILDNLNRREGQPDSTPVDKCLFTEATNGVCCYPKISIIEGLYRGHYICIYRAQVSTR